MIIFLRRHSRKAKYYMKKNNLAKLWLQKGREDLIYAQAVVNEVEIYGLLCFHCQQAVEKYLKGYLTQIGIKFRKTHKLPELLLLCIGNDHSFSKFKGEVLFLDKYYIEARYPVDSPQDHSKTEAKNAIKMAKQIINFVDKKFS